jgi:hypothetical protein
LKGAQQNWPSDLHRRRAKLACQSYGVPDCGVPGCAALTRQIVSPTSSAADQRQYRYCQLIK